MAQGNKILFWFRESFLLNNCGIYHALNESSEITPVFCFDPRESCLIGDSQDFTDYMQQQIHAAESLRNELKLRGSNLLVVGDYYETIIPSLARVLNISKLVTHKLIEPEQSKWPQLTDFRNQKAVEIFNILNNHSIPMVFEGAISSSHRVEHATFPRFPEINPGVIPPCQKG